MWSRVFKNSQQELMSCRTSDSFSLPMSASATSALAVTMPPSRRVQVRNDDTVAFARQPGAEILDLRRQSPRFMQEDEPGVEPFFLRPKLNTVYLHMFRDACLDIGIGSGIRQCGNGDATWKASGAGTDLIQGKGSDGRCHCGNLFSVKALRGAPYLRQGDTTRMYYRDQAVRLSIWP